MIRLRTLLQKTFPALITGGAGDDPAGVLTYTTVGAVAGFSQLWLLFLTTPLLVAAVGMVERVTRAEWLKIAKRVTF